MNRTQDGEGTENILGKWSRHRRKRQKEVLFLLVQGVCVCESHSIEQKFVQRCETHTLKPHVTKRNKTSFRLFFLLCMLHFPRICSAPSPNWVLFIKVFILYLVFTLCEMRRVLYYRMKWIKQINYALIKLQTAFTRRDFSPSLFL